MDYVVLFQDHKIEIDQVPEDIKNDVVEIASYLQHGDVKKDGVSHEQNGLND
ncbi:hypothetical protein FC41_GL001663 [Lactobacillus hominis DSM 23910 = CRBIP 24.179]|nr:hypothetical protein FC41_GL001663 [Lactobacillus hominis DSM 23910 = CRBIP 24.179]